MATVTIQEHGAQGDGNNDSFAFKNAVEDVHAQGGGTVKVPAGHWYAENIPVYSNIKFEGEGLFCTTIELPAGATYPMFVFTPTGADSDLDQGGWKDLTLKGLGISGPHGIDLSSAARWETGRVENCRIQNFNRGINGTARDRRPYITYCQFWSNNIGYYTEGDHTQIISCDFRNNIIGLSGNAMYDMQILNTVFAYNEHGIKPVGSIRQTVITNCQFFSNLYGGADVDERVVFSNCLLSAAVGISLTDSYGIKFKNSRSGWIGGIVNQETSASYFALGVFILNGVADICIRNVEFICRDFVRTDGTVTQQRHQITGCNGFTRGRFVYLESGVNGNQGCIISNNTIQITSTDTLLSAGEGVIEIDTAHPSIGNIITGNVIQASAAMTQDSIKADLRQSICKHNIIRNMPAINATATDAETINTENLVA